MSCALRSQVAVSLLDVHGVAQRSASSLITAPIPLTAHASMPAEGMNPAQGQHLADVTLEWPTVYNSGIGPVVGSSQCPQPVFVPVSVQITFQGQVPILVHNLGPDLVSPEGIGSLCGPHFSISTVTSL